MEVRHGRFQVQQRYGLLPASSRLPVSAMVCIEVLGGTMPPTPESIHSAGCGAALFNPCGIACSRRPSGTILSLRRLKPVRFRSLYFSYSNSRSSGLRTHASELGLAQFDLVLLLVLEATLLLLLLLVLDIE